MTGPDENRGPTIIAVSITTWLIGLISILLRFIARRYSGARIWWDDWLIIPAQVFTTGGMAIAITSTNNGFGQHISVVGLESQNIALKCIFATQFTYIWSICFVKFSILALYWRVFHTSFLKIPIIVMFYVAGAWAIALTFACTFQCSPVSAAFNLSLLHTNCIRTTPFWLGVAIPNIITDFILLLMPLPCIWSLQIPRFQKLLCSGIFLLGGLVSTLSIVRFVTLFTLDTNNPDITYNFVPTAIWTSVETHLGVLSACLPCMRPIFNFVVTGRFESRRGAGSTTGGSRSIRMGGGTWRNGTGNGVTGNRGFEALDTTKDSIIGKDGSVGSSQERITTETRVYATGKGSDGVTESELGGIVKEVKIDIR